MLQFSGEASGIPYKQLAMFSCQKTLVAVMSKSLRLRLSDHPQGSKWHLRLDMSVAQEFEAFPLLVFLVLLCTLDGLNQIQEVSRSV